MKIKKVNPRTISVHQDVAFGKSIGGCESGSTSNANVKREPISAITRADEKNSTIMIDSSGKSENDPTTSGGLDDFLNANGPSSVTIETSFPSPDKTISGMVS